jgi:hypothetical protein
MRIVFAVVGLLVLLLGLHWISEGTGILAYPHSPMMYLKPTWTYAGIVTAVVGLVLIWFARTMRGPKRMA